MATEPGEQGRPLQVAIDGFVATGKSTVGAAVAQRLGILYLDTGLMYRAVALEVLERGIDPRDAAACGELAETLDLHLEPPAVADGRQSTVRLGERDVTWAIRTPEVNAIVSRVSSHPRVRAALRARQQAIAAVQPVVIVGRDIASVVLPTAQVKILLTADLDRRVGRRVAELEARGEAVDRSWLCTEIARRDQEDSIQIRMMPDTIVISTDDLSETQVVERILEVIRERYTSA